MKRWILPIGAFISATALVAGIAVVGGIVPIKASSGHWGITAWMLDFAKKRSVSTNSIGIRRPDLEDPGLVQLGAGAYHNNCIQCHGMPGSSMPPVPAAMTPHPPPLDRVVPEYSPEELFYIVRHGIKFTGMPAWVADGRDDEVWAVVAFLLELSKMDQDDYQELVWGRERNKGDEMGATSALARCVGCHGEDGLSNGNPHIPVLAGQNALYLRNSLLSYATAYRHSGVMQPLASQLSPDEIDTLSEHYSSLRPPRPASPASALELVERGEDIAMNGDPGNRIPSCLDCHAQQGSHRKPEYPKLDGQSAKYLSRQLVLFKEETRGGSQFAHIMHKVVARLEPEQIEAVSAYFASRGATENVTDSDAVEKRLGELNDY